MISLLLLVEAGFRPPPPPVPAPAQPGLQWNCNLSGPDQTPIKLAGNFASIPAAEKPTYGEVKTTVEITEDPKGLIERPSGVGFQYKDRKRYHFASKDDGKMVSVGLAIFDEQKIGLMTVTREQMQQPIKWELVGFGICQVHYTEIGG